MEISLSRRALLQLAATGTSAILLESLAACGSSASLTGAGWSESLNAGGAADGEGWGPDWRCAGVGNLSQADGLSILEAGSDIFPNDPRPVAFLVDRRVRDASVRAVVARAGRAVGAVLRRTSTRAYYAAIYDTDLHLLSIVRRVDFALDTLSSAVVVPTALPRLTSASRCVLEFEVHGVNPTMLRAQLTGADGLVYETTALDATPALQEAGDAGVLTRADTLLPDSNAVLPALGNLHLLPYAVQEGQAVLESPVGDVLFGVIRARSTAAFAEIRVSSAEAPQPSAATVIAATTGTPMPGGATLHVAADLPAAVTLEWASSPDFSDSSRVDLGPTDGFDAATHELVAQPAGRLYWRARLNRSGLETLGPTRSFVVLPGVGASEAFTLAVGSCGSQFNQIFDHIAARQPDVFIWQGDLNYPDTQGPLAQTMDCYAGIWRHFLDNPRLAPILSRSAFVAGRDDHDYGLQDANSTRLLAHGIAPWDALMNPRSYQRISAGRAEIWVLDQRQYKSDPALPDTPEKTLLGAEQREWLFAGLASSDAPFKVICSPCTVAPSTVANARDGSWAAGFTAERELLLSHIRQRVTGKTIFLTGDTHFTMLWHRDGLFEQRACPLDIPVPNDVSIANPQLELTFGNVPGVEYWSRRSHFSFLTVSGAGAEAQLSVELVRDDGQTMQARVFSG